MDYLDVQTVLMAKIPPIPAHAFLRAWREHRGLSLQQVADALRVTHTTVGRWEKGQMKIREEVLHALAELYKVSPRQLRAPVEQAELVRRLDLVQDIISDMDEAAFEDLLRVMQRFRKTPD